MYTYITRDTNEKTQIKNNNLFENINSKYILQKILDNLERNKSLDIIKYNKNIHNRINIIINDYKEYLEIYSPIKLEIKPIDNKYGIFININKGDEKYFHIYFNNDKVEMKRNQLYKDDKIELIRIIIDYQVKSFEKLFYDCKCIESIHFKKFYRNNITSMSNMFSGSSLLQELNFSKFNTNNVTDMNHMFSWCSSLKELDISNFNINNVTDMNHMFSGCLSLKELNLPNFKENNLSNMRDMFSRCSENLKNKIRTKYENIKKEAFKDFI